MHQNTMLTSGQARSQGGPMGPVPHHQWFVPHHQTLSTGESKIIQWMIKVGLGLDHQGEDKTHTHN